jgi:succinate-acetate transporter protein
MQQTPSMSVVVHPVEAPKPPDTLLADPAPLGLAGFGLTTLILMVIDIGWLNGGATIGVLCIAAAYGGLAQFVAGLWAFRRGNTFAATAFCSFGAFWLSYVLFVWFFGAKIGSTDPAVSTLQVANGFVGLFLLSWGIFTAYMAIASLAAAKMVTVVFVLLAITFFILAIGAWGNDAAGAGFTRIGGGIGLLTAIAALYTSFADVTNATWRRVVLPTGAPFVH